MPNIAPIGRNNPAPDPTADELGRMVGQQGQAALADFRAPR